ncbi:hypothetical protein MGN70_014795 [Eutypa lata]|uniref:Putative upf0643 protein n=1 Tax=Eutypa lata (strain UCR-EL1) TaxID=1287681 RepID=M7TKY5_EUTLA|nr:putative upf0643 protein [Eutypa lata UCREL1]KAI1244917.1 hypothetical protein MGN70_014795 [Eutypa lata]
MTSVQLPHQRQGSVDPEVILEKQPAEISTLEVTASGDEGSTTPSVDESRLLVASPYTEREHLLNLDSLDVENALFAQALARMKNTRPDYATASYMESFNWDEVMGELTKLVRQRDHRWRETSFFVVVFRSQIPPTTEYTDLGALDKAAHAEATASGGFLK